MIKKVVHDPIFLAGKSEVATKEDLPVAQDLKIYITASIPYMSGFAIKLFALLRDFRCSISLCTVTPHFK